MYRIRRFSASLRIWHSGCTIAARDTNLSLRGAPMQTRTAEYSLPVGVAGAVVDHRPSPIAVLVVDDEEEARKVCTDVVEEAGLRVRSARTTEEALEILDQVPVDIVVTDLRVPELGGLDLLRRIREH